MILAPEILQNRAKQFDLFAYFLLSTQAVDNDVDNTAITLLSANYIYGFVHRLILGAYKYINKNNALKTIVKTVQKIHRSP